MSRITAARAVRSAVAVAAVMATVVASLGACGSPPCDARDAGAARVVVFDGSPAGTAPGNALAASECVRYCGAAVGCRTATTAQGLLAVACDDPPGAGSCP